MATFITRPLAQARAHLKQWLRGLNRRRLRHRRDAKRAAYADWVAQHDTLDGPARALLRARLARGWPTRL